jgi:hypothetical protein
MADAAVRTQKLIGSGLDVNALPTEVAKIACVKTDGIVKDKPQNI